MPWSPAPTTIVGRDAPDVREAALPHVATNPVLETLDHHHERSRRDGDAGRDEQLTGEGEFGHPHDADAHSHRSDDGSELIG